MGCKRLDGKQQMCNRFIEPTHVTCCRTAHTYFLYGWTSICIVFACVSICFCSSSAFANLQPYADQFLIDSVSLRGLQQSVHRSSSSMCFSGYLQIIFLNFPFLSYLYLYSMFIFYVSRRIEFVYVFSLQFIYHTQINLNKFLFSRFLFHTIFNLFYQFNQ